MTDAVRVPAEDRDIRSVLEEAFTEAEKVEAPAPVVEAKPAADAPEPEAETPAEPVAPEGTEQPKPDGEAEKPAGEKPEQPQAASPLEDLPIPAAEKERLAKLPPEAQEFVAKTWKSLQGDYTKKTQEVAAVRREYEPIDQLFAPYADLMRQRGFTKSGMINAWFNVEKALVEGKGTEVVAGILRAYPNIDRAKLAQLLGAVPQDGGGEQSQQPAPQAYVPPEILHKLHQLEQHQRQTDSERAAQAEQRITNDIEAFSSAKNDKGEPLHPYFAEVEKHMAFLLQAQRANGSNPSLQELYDTAVWANSATREKLLTAQKQQEKDRQDREARDRAAKAKKAASPVTGSPGASKTISDRPTHASRRDEIAALVAQQESAAI